MYAMRSRTIWLALVLGVALVASGCGAGDGLTRVVGEVTFDGMPVQEGRILFRKKGEPGVAFAAPILHGAYEARCAPGEMMVEITASRLIPGKYDRSNGTPEPVGEMYIPKRYNTATTLKVDIKPSQSNTVPFALTTR